MAFSDHTPDEVERLKNQVTLLNEALGQANRIRDRWQESTTALKASRKQLEESRQHYHSIMHNAFDAILIVDSRGAIREFNPAAARLFGYDSDTFAALSTKVLFDSEDLGELQSGSRSKETGSRGRLIEATGLNSKQRGIPLEITATGIELAGEPHALLTLRDITARKQAEKLAQQSRKTLESLAETRAQEIIKLSRAIEQSTESIIITDREGTIEYVNAAFSHITGFSAEEAIGNNPRMLKSDHYDTEFYHHMWQTILAGNKWEHKIIDRRKDGVFFHARLSISPIFDDRGEITHFVGIKQDLTEIERIEEQFHRAQKLEAVGTLAGGIAHEFNNILAGLTGNLYLSRSQCQDNKPLLQRISRMEGICLSAADMIRQLLTFARQDCQNESTLNISILLKETIRMARISIPETITLCCTLHAEQLSVNGDAALIQQIILNLVNNACHAVGDTNKPQIGVELDPFEADSAFMARHPDAKHMRFARLQVTDNGSGIAPDHLEHVFEPFFTTKAPGKGTGLGLSMIHGAVERYEGYIEVESEAGMTRFSIYLPLLEALVAANTTVDRPTIINGSTELILLVDDEPRVRAVTAEILRSLNYEVIEADDGIKASELCASMGHEISLIVMDIIMPRLGGIDAACNIRKEHPDIPIIFLTGYSKEHIKDRLVSLPRSMILNKPCSVEDLSRHIEQMLKQR